MIEQMKALLSAETVQRAARWVDESESGVHKALSALLPTLLSLWGKADLNSETPSAAFDFEKFVDSDLAQSANRLSSQLLGDKASALNQALSQYAGIGVGAASKLTQAASALALSLQAQLASGSDVAGANKKIIAEKATLAKLIPGAIGAALGLDSAAQSNAATSFKANSSKDKSVGFPLWILPVLAVASLGVWWMTRTPTVERVFVNQPAPTKEAVVIDTMPPINRADAQPSTEPLPTPTSSTEAPVSAPSVPELGAFAARTLPGDIKLNIPKLGIEARLVDFIEDASAIVDKEVWFDFDRILFDSKATTLRPESNEQIENLAAILKAFPNVQLKIGGYSDNTGPEKSNLALSQARADAVRQAIIARGIDAGRLSAEGYGSAHPVADNATAEGQQKNRRISARLTAK